MKKSPFSCGRVGCLNKATKRPLISFTAVKHPDGPRAVIQYPLLVCDDHAETDPLVYINDRGWNHIAQTLRHQNKAAPDRASLLVTFEQVFNEVAEAAAAAQQEVSKDIPQ